MGARAAVVHLANVGGGPACGSLIGVVTSLPDAVTCWRCGLRLARETLSRGVLRVLSKGRDAAGLAGLVLVLLALFALPTARAEDAELGPIKDPFPSSPPKKPPADPCVATCRNIRAKERACTKATAACENAYAEARKACRKACDAAARANQCGDDDGCKSTVEQQRQACTSSCDSASYELSACADKDRVCGEWIAARDDTSCQC
jgi:hypothetical protein